MLQYRNLNISMETRDHSKNGASLKSLMSKENIAKRIFLFFTVFCFCTANILAQDIITLKNGEDIQALVQEIGDVDVKYKKFDNPSGPNYTLKKSEIFMIRYANGSKDLFTQETATTPKEAPKMNLSETKTNSTSPFIDNELLVFEKKEFKTSSGRVIKYKVELEERLAAVPTSLALYQDMKKAEKRLNNVIIGESIVGGALVISGLILMNNDNTGVGMPLLGAGAGCYIGMAIGVSSANKNFKKISKDICDIYNKAVNEHNSKGYTSNVVLNFGITQSGGIGFVLNF